MDWANIVIKDGIPKESATLNSGSKDLEDKVKVLENEQDSYYLVTKNKKEGNPFGGFNLVLLGIVHDSLTQSKRKANKIADSKNRNSDNELIVFKVEVLHEAP